MARRLDFSTWHIPGRSPLIAYSDTVMQQITEDVLAASKRGDGGDETGGILFGAAADDEIRITAYRQAPRARRGDKYHLDEQDRTILQHLLETSSTSDPSLKDLVPVGWYHSHLEEPVALSPEDVEIWDAHFPFRWQVALVLRVQPESPVRAGFFFRPRSGDARVESSYREFDLAPRGPGDEGAPVLAPEPPAELFASPEESTAPRRWIWVVAGVGLAAMAAGAWWMRVPRVTPAAPTLPSANLRISEKDGYLTAQWDPHSTLFRRSRRAQLEITDGDLRRVLPLSDEVVRGGSWSLLRSTGDVAVRLQVTADDNVPTISDSARYIGAEPVAEAPPAAGPDPAEAARREVAALGERLRAITDANDALDRRAAALQERLTRRADAKGDAKEDARKSEAARAEQPKPEPPKPETPRPEVAEVRTPTPAVAPPPPPEPPRYTGPRSGRIIWTGYLPANSTLLIDGQRASSGSITSALPGVPVRISVQAAEISGGGLSVFTADSARASASEAGSAQTGWMKSTYVYDAARARDIAVAEAPAASAPARTLLRSGERAVTAVIIDWRAQ